MSPIAHTFWALVTIAGFYMLGRVQGYINGMGETMSHMTEDEKKKIAERMKEKMNESD